MVLRQRGASEHSKCSCRGARLNQSSHETEKSGSGGRSGWIPILRPMNNLVLIGRGRLSVTLGRNVCFSITGVIPTTWNRPQKRASQKVKPRRFGDMINATG
nr:hypothetical protein CFP56_74884 [Quercus suber]